MADYIKLVCAASRYLSEPYFIVGANRNCLFANRAFLMLIGADQSSEMHLELATFWPQSKTLDLSLEHLSTEFKLNSGDTYRVRLAVTQLDDGAVLLRVLAGSAMSSGDPVLHTQRLETLGMLASGIAHDFNNVLAGILGHVTFLKTTLPQSGPHLESLQAIEEGARKSSLMTQQILGFSKQEALEKVQSIDLGELISRTASLLRGAIPPEYQLDCEVPKEAISILAVESKLAQVLVNLVVNARDAIAQRGTISIKLSVVEDLEELGRAFKNKDLSARRYACITVQDDGRGIPPEIIERVFEAYFSTKDDRGTGLGLSTVDSIVRFYGGAVVLASQVNVGTTVSVYLPLVDLQKLSFKPALKPKQKKEVQGGTERILIVDDEYPVRNVLNVSLRHLGYHVDLAASGREAIATFCERVDGYDLVILDILMPQLSGEETFLELKHLAPTVKVLLMSGYSSPEVVKRLLQKGAGGFMQKPFTIDQLASKVRECLDSKDSGNN